MLFVGPFTYFKNSAKLIEKKKLLETDFNPWKDAQNYCFSKVKGVRCAPPKKYSDPAQILPMSILAFFLLDLLPGADIPKTQSVFQLSEKENMNNHNFCLKRD